MMSYERFVWEGGGGGVWKPRVQFKVDVFQCPVCLGTKRATSLIRYLFPKEQHRAGQQLSRGMFCDKP